MINLKNSLTNNNIYIYFWLVEIFYQFGCHRQDPIKVNTNKKNLLTNKK